MNWLQLLLRLWLGIVFIQSGVEKLDHMPQFLQIVQAYNVLPDFLARAYAQALPWLEILAGGYLVIGLFTRYAAATIGLMLVSFIIALVTVLIRGESIDCGCFVGGEVEPVSWGLVIRDIVMLAGCVPLILIKTPRWSVDGWLNKESKN